MEQLRARKIKTVESGNTFIALFETGKLKQPITLMDEYEAEELRDELNEALGYKSADVSERIKVVYERDGLISAVKLYRELTSKGLVESKRFVDRMSANWDRIKANELSDRKEIR